MDTMIDNFKDTAFIMVLSVGIGGMLLLTLMIYMKMFDAFLKLVSLKKLFVDFIWHQKEFKRWLENRKSKKLE